MREEILDIMKDNGDLPPFPDVLIELQNKLDDPLAGVSDFARLIEMEPTLSGNILKIANNAYYNAGFQEVKTLMVAINKLGIGQIRNLAFSLQLTGLFSDNGILDYFRFWRHSLAVAFFTQRLSPYANAPAVILDTAYLSGLLHDVGIMIFAYLIPDEYAFFLRQLPESEEPLQQKEKEVFDIDHQELGALFMEDWWKIDPKIVHTVQYHHFPFDGTDSQRQCAQMVHVADGICNNMGFDSGIDSTPEVFKEGAWEQLGLSLEDVDNITKDVEKAMSQAWSFWATGSGLPARGIKGFSQKSFSRQGVSGSFGIVPLLR